MRNAQTTKRNLIEELKAARQRLSELEQVKEALLESEEKFSSIFYHSPIGLSLTRLSDGVVLEINDSYTAFTGYARADIIGRKVTELNIWASPEDRERMMKILNDEGRVSNKEFYLHVKSGDTHPVLISTENVNIGGEDCMLVMALDITERKLAEEELRESEEFTSSLLTNAPNAIFVTYPDNTIKYVNPAFEKLTGFTLAEIIGIKTPYPWWPEETKNEIGAWLKETGFSVGLKREMAFQKKSGEHFWVELNASLIEKDGKQKYRLINWVDITERKKMEQALRESEVKFRNLFEHAKDAVILADADTEILVDINPAGCRMLGLPKDQIIGRHQTIIHPPEMAEQAKHFFREHVATGDVLSEEIILRRADGTHIPADVSASVIKLADKTIIQGVFRDITERKKAEKALQESEEKFSKAFKAASDAMAIYSSQGGKFIEVNDSYMRLNGYSRDELIGHNADDLNMWANPEDRQKILRLTKEKGWLFHEEFSLRTKSGEIRTCLFSAESINISGEKRMIVIIQDITERKQAEKALHESEEKFSKVFNASLNPICIVTADDLKFVDINQSFTSFTGYTRGEVIGHSSMEINLWEKEDDFNEMTKILMEKGRLYNHEYRSRMKSGEIKTGLFSVEIMEIGERICLIFVITDITERKQVEEALRESEDKYRQIFNNVNAVIVRLDKYGKVTEINSRAEEFYGFRPEDVLGKQFTELGILTVEDLPKIAKMFGDTVSGKQLTYQSELETRDKAGNKKYIDVNSTVVKKDDKIDSTISIIYDVTERRKAEEKLRFSDAAFKSLRESVIAMDTQNTITYWNSISEQLFGVKASEAIGKNFFNVVKAPVNTSEKYIELHQKLMSQGYNRDDMLYVTPRGNVWVDMLIQEIEQDKQHRGYMITALDITERKQAEEALRESEEKFSKAFNSGANAVCITSLTDNKFVEINEAYTRFTGYTRAEVIDHTAAELNLWVVDEELKQVQTLLKKDGKFNNIEFHSRMKSGEIRTGLGSAELINIGGQPCRIVVITDITKRKKTEEGLKQAMANLEQSSAQLGAANKELEAFSYSVSHDLRSPLRSIDGFSQALLEDYANKLDDTAQDYLKRLRGASQKMGELIDGLLKLSRLSRSEMHREKVDLSALADEITSRLHETQPERKVEFIIGRELTANGDPQLLRALLENLLGNAWKFTGKVPLAKIEFGATRNGALKTFFVKDNGAGFDMTYVDKLFGAFQRLHDATDFPGTGIGLATVRRIINRHGGIIRAEGEVGKGATFYFTLD